MRHPFLPHPQPEIMILASKYRGKEGILDRQCSISLTRHSQIPRYAAARLARTNVYSQHKRNTYATSRYLTVHTRWDHSEYKIPSEQVQLEYLWLPYALAFLLDEGRHQAGFDSDHCCLVFPTTKPLLRHLHSLVMLPARL